MNILDEIVEVKKEEIKKLRNTFSISSFRDSEFFEKPKLDFYKALAEKEKISIIAEIKKASPSKGIIREDFDHKKIADIYFENEIDAVSILTDINFFKGSITFLNEIAKIKSAPLLRKDFIIDEYQIFEAKSNGADAILLIAEVLTKNQLNELTHAAIESDLDVLLELHSEDQISKIDFSLNKIIGVNNRNLKDFSVSLDSTFRISEQIPIENILVSESGINNQISIDKLKTSRTNAVLVGEHFMRQNNIGDEIKDLKNGANMKVKICGITNLDDAMAAIDNGADSIGFILYDRSKRFVEMDVIKDIISKTDNHIDKIGVFVNENIDTVNFIADKCGLTKVQLHGEESPDYIKNINFPVIKSFRISNDFNFEQIADYKNCEFLFDSFSEKDYGGTGKTFKWGKIPNHLINKIILAGGISVNNVQFVLENIKPGGIDLSSSLELYPGKKDHEKIKEFFKVVNKIRS